MKLKILLTPVYNFKAYLFCYDFFFWGGGAGGWFDIQKSKAISISLSPLNPFDMERIVRILSSKGHIFTTEVLKQALNI